MKRYIKILFENIGTDGVQEMDGIRTIAEGKIIMRMLANSKTNYNIIMTVKYNNSPRRKIKKHPAIYSFMDKKIIKTEFL